jgi:phosphoglycolate phosphatase-like HAD superfamily hydrolase
MELKHKECFIPEFIRSFGLQSVSTAARETWEFVNLYSLDRGVNRFPALVKTLDLLVQRPVFKDSGLPTPDYADIRAFTVSGKPQSNAGLKDYLKVHDTPVLRNLLEWSEAVNMAVGRMVHAVSPFPSAKKALEQLFKSCDMMVVSGTPTASLQKEWKEHDIERYVRLICGQEAGSKKDHLTASAKGKYAAGKILMIGDAPGDHKAAQSVGALFFPVNPGAEEDSWKLFLSEGLQRFLEGTFTGKFQDALTGDFYSRLPERPVWD